MEDSNQSSIQKSSDFKEISREDLQKLLLYRREESDRKPEEDSMFFKFLREILGLTKDSEKEKKAVSSIDNFVEKYFPQAETKDLLEHRQEIKGKAINIGGKRIEIFDKDKAVEVAKAMMERRHIEFTEGDQAIFDYLFTTKEV